MNFNCGCEFNNSKLIKETLITKEKKNLNLQGYKFKKVINEYIDNLSNKRYIFIINKNNLTTCDGEMFVTYKDITLNDFYRFMELHFETEISTVSIWHKNDTIVIPNDNTISLRSFITTNNITFLFDNSNKYPFNFLFFS